MSDVQIMIVSHKSSGDLLVTTNVHAKTLLWESIAAHRGSDIGRDQFGAALVAPER